MGDCGGLLGIVWLVNAPPKVAMWRLMVSAWRLGISTSGPWSISEARIRPSASIADVDASPGSGVRGGVSSVCFKLSKLKSKPEKRRGVFKYPLPERALDSMVVVCSSGAGLGRVVHEL